MKFFLLLFAILIYCCLHAQNSVDKPVNLKEGTFYLYPEYFTSAYRLVRKGDVQKEYKIGEKDSSEWRLTWKNDSVYTLTYIKGGDFTAAEQAQMKTVTGYYAIRNVTKEHYVYTRYDDPDLTIPIMRDTIRFTEKKYNPLAKMLFEPVANKGKLDELETSKEKDFALVYFYTPRDDNYSQVVKDIFFKNGTFGYMVSGIGYTFKFQKEGPVSFLNHLDDSSPFVIDIEFGKKYFIKTTFSGLVKNPKANFRLMEQEKGRAEFEKTLFFEFSKDI